ncbi:hypothetical protein T484DRAFT_1757088 [Baffinella frigidus]|nr:hypothetical protein T484DRAFT_1757088 [Cryptophyta sp. CCMP2293]
MQKTIKKYRSKLLIKRKGSTKRAMDHVKTTQAEMSGFYDVETVHEERVGTCGDIEYLVSWAGYARSEDSWIKDLPAFFLPPSSTYYVSATNATDSDLYMLASMACLEFSELVLATC